MMTAEAMQAVGDAYEAKFHNLGDIAMPQIIHDPRFMELLQRAIERGSPVTSSDLGAVFPEEDWEEVRP